MRGRRDTRGRCSAVLGAALLLLWATPLGAQAERGGSGASRDEQSELEALLQQETELATKTRMNHDYVPGMVTVLSGDELEALGVRNVWEALSLLPGVQSVRDSYAGPLILVRGINFIFNSGNIKILVDSVPLNREGAGINSSILLMPIGEVERVEFMRGPGSAIHGDFAYLGLLNIVTRRDERRLYGSVDADSLAGGAHVSFSNAGAGQRLSLGLSGFVNRDVDGRGPASFEERAGFGRIFWGLGGLTVSVQALAAQRPEGTGAGSEPHSEHRLAAEVRYAADPAPSLHVEAHAGLLQNNDAVGAKGYDGLTLQGGLDLRWRAPGRHTLLLTLDGAREEILRASLVLPPLFDFTVSGVVRSSVGVALQDQWDLTEGLALTAGLRVDALSDLRTRVTPRFALVWSVDEHQIVKAQYAEGFRSPGFWELYGTGRALPGLEAETIAATELSYIVRRAGFVGRATLFRSELRNLIQPPGVPGGDFSNASSAKTSGVELEWTQQVTNVAKVSTNVSFAEPDDHRFTRDVLAASRWMWNVSLLSEPAPWLPSWLRLGARWNHVGPRGGFDGAGTIPGYDTIDLTATASNLLRGLTFRGGVRNALDDEVVYITTLPPPLDPIRQRYGGRTFWAELSFRF